MTARCTRFRSRRCNRHRDGGALRRRGPRGDDPERITERSAAESGHRLDAQKCECGEIPLYSNYGDPKRHSVQAMIVKGWVWKPIIAGLAAQSCILGSCI